MSDQQKDKEGSGNDKRDRSRQSSEEQEAGPSGSSGARRGSSPVDKLQGFVTNLLSKLTVSTPKPKVLESNDIDAVVNFIQSEKCKNIIVMAGAGISTSAGIPDFRSPSTGLYANIMMKYQLPDPQVMFEIGFFKKNPEPFYSLAKELFPQELNPTPSHHFVRLLHNKGFLLRHYTQNIDGLERLAGIPGGKIVEAHGSFHTSHCMSSSCRKEHSFDWMKEKIYSETLPKCTQCDTLVKPDVVFFGENLPARFFDCMSKDFPQCDLLIIMGTSLVVQPFSHLVERVPDDCPRVLINREIVGTAPHMFARGMNFKSERNRDIAILGDCDDGVRKLAKALGWEQEFDKLCSGQGQAATNQPNL
ncbi:unnamed protein product [Orchesella dallaii]|uniref:NAD-dependent protein deacetylase n=1 Tax=Orchesella dallaii TaxID=48710 RepID=A0ABP1S6D5_9HEXA